MRIGATLERPDGKHLTVSRRATAYALAAALRGVKADKLILTIELDDVADVHEIIKHLPIIAECLNRDGNSP